MIKILVSTPIDYDSTSFYRVWGVLHNLTRKMNGRLQLDNFKTTNYTWAQLAGYKILFLHRPYSAQAYQLAGYCKTIGVKIWVDFDDNLFNLPPENRAYDNYDLEVKKLMRSTLELADIVTVSTQPLKNFFAEALKVTAPIEVVPNALNDDLFKLPTAPNTQVNYTWRGSETHAADIIDYLQEIYEAMSANNHLWHWLGYRPYMLMRHFMHPKLSYYKPSDPIPYHTTLQSIAPWLMHVPLTDNALNHSKSNIAWIEATYAGGITLAPAWPEWLRPGVINYTTPEQYKQHLINLPTEQQHANHWQQSADFINEHLLLSRVNEQRQDIIEKLLSNHKDVTTKDSAAQEYYKQQSY